MKRRQEQNKDATSRHFEIDSTKKNKKVKMRKNFKKEKKER